MALGASNKFADVLESFGQSYLCVLATRSVDISVPAEPGDDAYGERAFYRASAAKAADLGCGNCGEQAAVAFMYLKDAGVRPLDLMAYQDPGDHAFVVIGRVEGSD